MPNNRLAVLHAVKRRLPQWNTFHIDFDFLIQDLYDGFVADFFRVLEAFGLRFKCGFWDGSGMTFAELIEVFQKKLSQETADIRGNYQIMFSFSEFSAVRGYWYTNDQVARFTIILPEEDFVDMSSPGLPSDVALRKNDVMEEVKALAVFVWENSDVCCIQTAWEWSDVPCLFDEIRDKKEWPQAEPFAFFPMEVFQITQASITQYLSRNGVIVDSNIWNCVACWGRVLAPW